MYDIALKDTYFYETLNSVDMVFEFKILTDKEYFFFSEELFGFIFLDNKMFNFYKNTLNKQIKDNKELILTMLEDKKCKISTNRICKRLRNDSFVITISFGNDNFDLIERQINNFCFSSI